MCCLASKLPWHGAAFIALAIFGGLPGVTVVSASSKTRHGRLLSEEPRIEYRTGFLKLSDAEAIRRLAVKLGFQPVDEATADVSGGEEFVYLNMSAMEGKAAADSMKDGWAASQRFMAAAMDWAGIQQPTASPVVTRWESWEPGSHLNRSGLLHLDSRLKPRLRTTVLAYLGSGRADAAASGADAGFTVFPCIETDDMDAKEVSRRERLCSRAQRHVRLAQDKLLTVHEQGMQLPPSQQLAFLKEHPELTGLPQPTSDGTRPVNWQWTAKHDEVARSSPGALRADPLFALAEAMCRGKAPGLRIAPTPGSAVLLEAAAGGAKGELVPHWQMWHTGCSPMRGQGRRWTLQLFLDSAAAGECSSREATEAAAGECSRPRAI